MKKQTMLRLAALSGVPFLMVLGNSMLIPVFPKMQSVLHITQMKAGLLITAFSIPAGITIPFAGFLSDRVGRLKIIIPALIVYGAGGLIAGTAALLMKQPYYVILAARVLQGIGAAGTAPVAMALVGDIFKSKERTKALGIIEAANGLGKVASPILGSLIALIIWYAPFFVYGVLSIPIALAVYFVVKEPEAKGQTRSVKQYFQALGDVARTKGLSLAALFLGGMVVLFLLFGVLVYLSDVLEKKYKIEGVLKGSILAIPVLTMAITSSLSGFFLQKRRPWMKAVISVGLGLITASLAAAAFFKSTVMFFAAMSVVGIGSGLVLPSLNTLVTSATSLQQRGAVTSVYGSVRFFGVAIGPPVFNLLAKYGSKVLFLAASGVGGVAFLAAIFLINQQKILGGGQAPAGRKAQKAGKELPSAGESEAGESEVSDLRGGVTVEASGQPAGETGEAEEEGGEEGDENPWVLGIW